jgi:hypothetical protein
MGDTPSANAPAPAEATPASNTTPVEPSRFPWLLVGVLVLFALLFLFAVAPVLAGAGLALALVGTVIALLPDGEPVTAKPKKKDHRWTISGTSPVRQELTLSGTGRASIGFWFTGNQSIEYLFDVFDDAGNELRYLPSYPHGEPNNLCWVGDEAGPGGYLWGTDKHPWTVTIRYVLRATDERVVRSAELHVEVKPATAEVTVPEKPLALSAPRVQWGRLDTPPDQLKELPPGAEWKGPPAR